MPTENSLAEPPEDIPLPWDNSYAQHTAFCGPFFRQQKSNSQRFAERQRRGYNRKRGGAQVEQWNRHYFGYPG